MSKNYFVIERQGQYWENVKLRKYPTMTWNRLNNLKNSTYEEMKNTPWINSFIVAVMNAANDLSGQVDETTIINLIGNDGVFIWGILMGLNDAGDISYSFIDWKKNGRNYRYEDSK